MTDRVASSCTHKWSASTCKKCGIYDHPSDPAIKTSHFESYLNSSSAKYLKNMRKRQCKQIYNKQINQATFCLLQSICQKFQYSTQTLALGIHIYGKTSQKSQKDQKFWASAALIVASKAIELDKRVPYLNRYQRYADKSYSQQQYEEAQRTIFEDIQFNVQFTTFVTFLNFYLTSGVLFKSDSFNIAIMKYIQDDMVSKARDYLKTGEFLKWNQEMLALSIVKEIRSKFRLDPWKKQLQLISGFTEQQISNSECQHSTLKPSQLPQKNKQKQPPIKHLAQRQPLSLNFLQNSLTLPSQPDQKQKSKKPLQSTLKLHNLSTTLNSTLNSTTSSSLHSHSLLSAHHNVKENSGKILADIPLSLATLRNHVTSANKYGIGDRLATVSSFVTSRRF